MVDYGLGCSVTSPLSWRRTGDSADVQVLFVGARSVMHAQVVGAAIIPNGIKTNTSHDRQQVPWSSTGTWETAQEKILRPKFTKFDDMKKSTRNAATRTCLRFSLSTMLLLHSNAWVSD